MLRPSAQDQNGQGGDEGVDGGGLGQGAADEHGAADLAGGLGLPGDGLGGLAGGDGDAKTGDRAGYDCDCGCECDDDDEYAMSELVYSDDDEEEEDDESPSEEKE